MTNHERKLVQDFKSRVQSKLHVCDTYVFGSRARGDAGEGSDLDVLVVIEEPETSEALTFIFDCAYDTCWEDGFTVLISPTVFSRERWQHSPERSSPLALAVREEGIPV